MTPADLAEALLTALAANSLFAALVFLLMVALARLPWPNREAVQHALFGLVLVRLFLPPFVSWPFSVYEGADRLVALGAPGWSVAFRNALVPASPAVPPATSAWLPLLLTVLVLFWIAPVLVRLVRTWRAHRVVVRAVRAARGADHSGVTELADACRHALRLRARPRILVTPMPVSPFTVGVLRPAVVLPETLLDPSRRGELAAAIAHELAHVKRRDAAWNALASLARALFWFHPLLSPTIARMRAAAEADCDRLAVAASRLGPKAYARSLVNVSAMVRVPLGASGFAAGGELHRRVRDVLTRRRATRGANPLVVAGIFGVTLLPLSVPSAWEIASPLERWRLTSGFGERLDPFSKTRRHHDGIDLVPRGDWRVRAPAAGVVVTSTDTIPESPGWGRVIVLDHGEGLTSFYAHLGRRDVEEGEAVDAGAVIGRVGKSGRCTGPHLHFELRRYGKPIDPLAFVGVDE